jgi:hypothetical protein
MFGLAHCLKQHPFIPLRVAKHSRTANHKNVCCLTLFEVSSGQIVCCEIRIIHDPTCKHNDG